MKRFQTGIDGEKLRRRVNWTARVLRGTDRKLLDNYLRGEGPHKLHLGCGDNVRPGWLNSDYNPQSDSVLHLDATTPFPLPDASLDYVFSEHMIEHLSYADGMRMLRECHRVLRPGGKVRISTPDLDFVVDLHRQDKSELQQSYIRWATEQFIEAAPYAGDTFVMNNFVRDWGHLFIYDVKTLSRAMESAGFTDITKHQLNESEDLNLVALENDSRMPQGFLQLESFTLEGVKATSR
jgi:predicted SAM-dependent methyltransferase